MKHITHIMIFSLCAALSLASCNKKHHTPDEDNHRVPLSFTALSQTPALKSTTPLSEFYSDFGVWGIARKTDNPDYILWDQYSMSQVIQQTAGSNLYVPSSEAYWFNGFTYDFIAVAPYTNGVQGLAMTKPAGYANDALKFTYSISGRYQAAYSQAEYDSVKDYYKYENPAYACDLMGAVAETSVNTTKPQSQELTFSHLLAKVGINIQFTEAKDATGQDADVTVTRMLLQGVDTQADYTLTFGDGNALVVECENSATPENLSFTGAKTRINIIPQPSDFILLLDFTIGEGQNAISTTNYKIDMSNVPNNPENYIANGWYSWDITISPKHITFDVTVSAWTDGGEFEFPIE